MKIYTVSGIFLRWSDDEIIKFLVIFILFSHCVLDWSEDSIMMVCDFPHVLEFSLYSQPVTIVFRPFISDFPIRHRYISFPAADSALNIIPAGLCDEKTAMVSRACLFFRCFSQILLRPVDFRMIDSISEILSKVFRSEYIIFSCQSFTRICYSCNVHMLDDVYLGRECHRIQCREAECCPVLCKWSTYGDKGSWTIL